MKKLLTLSSIIICIAVSVQGQINYVSNGSFEVKSACPSNYSQVNNCNNWRQYTQGTSDYFNVCGGTNVSVPSNSFGYQNAASGAGYVGGYVYVKNDARGYKEYIAGKLVPLSIGTVYEVSMSVSLGNGSLFGTNDLGVFFYDTFAWRMPGVQSSFQVTPQVSWFNQPPIMDTTNWIRLVDTFTADSAYDNIIVGGFLDYSSMTTNSFGQVQSGFAYYYFDSIVVRILQTITLETSDSLYCAGDTFSANVFPYGQFYANNVFRVELSDKNGSFSMPDTLGSQNTDTTVVISCVIPPDVSTSDSYKLRVISSNPVDTSNYLINIRIGNLDSANIQVVDNSPLCMSDTLRMFTTHNGTAGYSYSWNGPNNYTSSQRDIIIPNPSTSYTGTYDLTTQLYGCTQFDTIGVLVKPNPNVPSATSNSAVCTGDSLKLFAASTTSGVSYSWTGPNSFSSNVQNPLLPNSTMSMSGVYRATVTKSACSSSATTQVVINQTPDTVTLTSNTPICVGDTLKISSTSSTSGATYSWTGPNSFTLTSQNITIANASVITTGVYRLLISGSGCTIEDSLYANVFAIPSKPSLTSNGPLCVGETLSLSANSINGVGYTWVGPNSFTSSSQSPSVLNVSLSSAGIYKVKANNNLCVSDEDSISVQINVKPFVLILTNKDTLCDGESITFNSLPTSASSNLSYQWYVNAQPIIGSNQPTYTTAQLKNNDVVSLYMTDSAKCSTPHTDQSNDIQLTVLPWLTPSVSIAVNPTGPVPQDSFLTFIATAIDAGSPPLYQWKRNGSDILGATADTWSANTLNDNDSVSVEVESTYRCPQPKTAVSNGIIVRILSNLTELNGKLSNVRLYPNPNNGLFTFTANVNNTGLVPIKIYDAAGKLVYNAEASIKNGKLIQDINIRGNSTGIYMLHLMVGDKPMVIRFSISR